jgi:hypothetical protein
MALAAARQLGGRDGYAGPAAGMAAMLTMRSRLGVGRHPILSWFVVRLP